MDPMILTLPAWIYPIIVWTAIWKGIALWKAGRHNQPAWFVVMLILNTVGILPIIYLAFFQGKRVDTIEQIKKAPAKKKKVKKKR